jgi:hypothetical protein
MTEQIPDDVAWNGRTYLLDACAGGPLFEPAAHGLAVRSISTACRRGYLCEYTVSGDELALTSLTVGMDRPPAELFGAPGNNNRTGASYVPIHVPVPLTGGVLVKRDRTTRVRRGGNRLWEYREVAELVFEGGRIAAVHDYAPAMEAVRAGAGDLDPRSDEADRIWHRFRPAFACDYWPPA